MGNRTTRVEFAERVQEVRKRAGLSTEQLAVKSGIAYTTLRRRLSGAPGQFTLDELDALAEATGSTFGYLVSGVEQTPQAVAS